MSALSHLHPVFQEILEACPLVPVPPDRHAEAPHLRLHPQDPDVLIESTPDGPDFIRICHRHQWCSVSLPEVSRPSCPLCEAEEQREAGRRRYIAVLERVLKTMGSEDPSTLIQARRRARKD